jgi:ketosteroid isomerase-like protein
LQYKADKPKEDLMPGYRFAMTYAAALAVCSTHANDFVRQPPKAHFYAFNSRDWDAIKSVLMEDPVLHRAKGDQVFLGPDAIVERFSTMAGRRGRRLRMAVR